MFTSSWNRRPCNLHDLLLTIQKQADEKSANKDTECSQDNQIVLERPHKLHTESPKINKELLKIIEPKKRNNKETGEIVELNGVHVGSVGEPAVPEGELEEREEDRHHEDSLEGQGDAAVHARHHGRVHASQQLLRAV
ncbi:hypothetical protein PYW07_008526 [Mythimna separata]|uniref:Uncharacterized protein n=1 Tax=Mythimna separata TaxID=271217 RepID=A0AAD7YCU6_MYTSE|nr:hypothetical protein PYW07_008526 [Mythimna separata]